MGFLHNSQFFSAQRIKGDKISREERPSWEPSWDQSWDANRASDHDLHPNLMKLGKLCPPNLAKVGHRVEGQVGPKVGLS